MQDNTTIRFLVTGDVVAPHFPGWIRAHAAKLGLSAVATDLTDAGLRVEGNGPREMLDALGIACSLGPAGVMVDRVIQSEP